MWRPDLTAHRLDIPSGTTFNEFEGMGGDDTITGNGNTRITYVSATGGVTVDLAAGTAAGDASVGNGHLHRWSAAPAVRISTTRFLATPTTMCSRARAATICSVVAAATTRSSAAPAPTCFSTARAPTLSPILIGRAVHSTTLKATSLMSSGLVSLASLSFNR